MNKLIIYLVNRHVCISIIYIKDVCTKIQWVGIYIKYKISILLSFDHHENVIINNIDFDIVRCIQFSYIIFSLKIETDVF